MSNQEFNFVHKLIKENDMFLGLTELVISVNNAALREFIEEKYKYIIIYVREVEKVYLQNLCFTITIIYTKNGFQYIF